MHDPINEWLPADGGDSSGFIFRFWSNFTLTGQQKKKYFSCKPPKSCGCPNWNVRYASRLCTRVGEPECFVLYYDGIRPAQQAVEICPQSFWNITTLSLQIGLKNNSARKQASKLKAKTSRNHTGADLLTKTENCGRNASRNANFQHWKWELILDNLKNKYARLHYDKKLVAYKIEHFKLVIQFINYANWV